MHATKRHGEPDTRVLYWFRTPPYVKVGRAALDDETMRLIEESHPGLSFDWPRILREQPQSIPEEQALRRREHRDARDAKRKKKRLAPSGPEPGSEPVGARPVPAEPIAAEAVPAEDVPAAARSSEAAEPTIEQLVASEVLGVEAAAHLRNRYVVLRQRIERVSDEATREALRANAAGLDPGRWETVEAVRAAMERYEALYESVRSQVGGGRRRRRRRRGRGKPGGETPPSTGV